MANIFINGLNAKAGGGKSIFNNYLTLLSKGKANHTYFILTPNASLYKQFNNENIIVLDISVFLKNTLLYPFVYGYFLNQVLKKYNIDVVFNLADIPINTRIKQAFLFDWSYAVYPESIVWKLMDFKSKIIRKIKLFFFKKYFNHIDLLIAQTETIKKRLEKYYGVNDIKVIPNAVSLENMEEKSKTNFNFPAGIKLLYLTHYYPHKNIEIFIPLAKEIKKRGLNYKMITTIDSKQHNKASIFLENIEKEKLSDVIFNIGAVEMENVPTLYKQCNGLLMPTLLESFSGTYVEAMFHQIPIFTSDIDFARDVCKEAGTYFDPFNPISILDNIELLFNNTELKNKKILKGYEILNRLPNWQQTFEMYNKAIEETIKS